MRVTLDPSVSRFLLDHRVNGQPLLPTVMALDLMGRAALCARPGRQPAGLGNVTGLRNVTVGPPVIFPAERPKDIELLLTPAVDGRTCDVVLIEAADAAAQPRYTATVILAEDSGGAMGSLAAGPGHPGVIDPVPVEIYPPYFHGPSMQVLGAAARAGGDLWAELRAGQPLLSWPESTVTAPTLLELWMQSCGLWELLDTGRMMIPRHLEFVAFDEPERLHATGSLAGARARVRPRPGPAGGLVFDGNVADRAGKVALTVRGYRTADMGVEVPDELMRAIRAAIGAERVAV